MSSSSVSTELDNADAPAASPAFRRVVKYAVLGGLTQFVPVPWLDDWLLELIRKTMVYRVLKHQDLPVDPAGAKVLALGPDKPFGCLSAVLGIPRFIIVEVILYGFKKLLKKIFLLFTIREYAKVVIDVFEQGYLILAAAESKRLPPDAFQAEELLVPIHAALERARREPHNAMPFRQLCMQALKGSRTTAIQAAKALGRLGRKLKARWSKAATANAVIDDEEELGFGLDNLIQSLADGVWTMPDYLESLRRSLDREMNAAGTPPPLPADRLESTTTELQS